MRLALFAALAACSEGGYPTSACSIQCSAQLTCPAGSLCGVDGYCHVEDDATDCSTPDPPAAPPSDAAPPPVDPDPPPSPPDAPPPADAPVALHPVHRSFNPQTGEHFYSIDESLASCCGFQVETYDYYWVAVADGPGLAPWYQCQAYGRHFTSTHPTCEGFANEGLLGYVRLSDSPATVPLWRLYHHDVTDHFFTWDPVERAAALANGYADEGTPAYVWRDP